MRGQLSIPLFSSNNTKKANFQLAPRPAKKPAGQAFGVEFERRARKIMGFQYPISVHVKPYSGNKEKLKQEYIRRIHTTRRIEDYINSYMTNSEGHIFMYYEIAAALGLSTTTVHDLLMPVCGGSNGITVDNPKFHTQEGRP